MGSTLIKTEISYNTRDNSKTTTQTYESFDGYGSEVNNMANRKFSHENGVYRYSGDVVEYFVGTGESSGSGGSSDIYSIEISTSTEPIETHPLFAPISSDFWKYWEIWKADKTSDLLKTANLPEGYKPFVTSGYWDPAKFTLTPINILVAKWMKGVREYFVPRMVSRHQTSGAPTTLSNVGKIDTPAYAFGITGRNWLFTGASSRFNVATGIYETTYEWLASGPKLWDDDLY